MKKEYIIFLFLFAVGIIVRIVSFHELDWFLGSKLHVDEVTYTAGDTPPFERPPGAYIVASLSKDTITLRSIFSALSMIPALALFLFRKKNTNNAILAGFLAIEPTLAFSGLQILPSAPAAAFIALALTSGKDRPRLLGWFLGCAALFRGELLLFLPVAIVFIKPFKRYLTIAGGMLMAVLPVLVINFVSGGPFALAENGSLNLWLGSSWEYLETPPGIEYEELLDNKPYAENALITIKEDFPGWLGRGSVKIAGFLSVPGYGRNIEAPELLSSTVLKYMLPLTLMIIVLGISGFRQNPSTALVITGLTAAFIFFPSMRHRAVFLPALLVSALNFRWKIAIPAMLAVALFSLFIHYPGSVRSGLTQVQLAQNYLELENFEKTFQCLQKAEESGYTGADIHMIRGVCIASSGGNFHDAVAEFALVIKMVPEAPTAWKNMAALLWNNGYNDDAFYAAEKAVGLDPALYAELSSILSCQR